MFMCLPCPALAQDAASDFGGIYTNEEQVYFDGEAGRVPPPWIGIRIERTASGELLWHSIDRFGAIISTSTLSRTADRWTLSDCAPATPADDNACAAPPAPVVISNTAISLNLADGRQTDLRRARPVTCWLTVRRTATKPDGGEDWLFAAGLTTHDQGGRLKLGGGDSGAPMAIIRIRNVIWPEPTRNRPSVVLYVFTQDDPNRAAAYSWADPGAARIGINLRWMQASCTIDGAE